ncbi:MAG TPA: DUF3761 domain-containing protein [Gaiellaceae bacterium]|nr:DUF3761 domain-containing protein [Gaiellaceae bacterium]
MRLRRLAALVSVAVCAGFAGSATAAPAHHATAAPFCKKGYYKNVSGHCVKSPTKAAKTPAGATAKCRDGTYSFSEHASGTCSHHGGVARWIHHP